ncbi:MAG: NAD-dependent epimerase/dehydratase family protein [Candidatus Thorarchaeota archaeon]
MTERVLVTGGAGFIGSHLVDRLIESYDIIVLDDLSAGLMENIQQHMSRDNFEFIKGSISSQEDVHRALEGVSMVFHFAAQPDVRLSAERPLWDFNINVTGSMLLLDTMRQMDVSKMIFASSGGTVYGDAEVFPTPESTAFRPISNYGAAKGAFEMYLSSYAELYGINSVSLRLANIIGPRSTHGVIYDFYMKIKQDPTRLEVLGDGTQDKAYMYVSDMVEAAFLLAKRMKPGYQPVNIGSGQRLRVSRITELVCEELGVPEAQIVYTGTKRGWAGDVTITDIDISLLKSFGWSRKVELEDGVRMYIRWLVDTFGPIQ